MKHNLLKSLIISVILLTGVSNAWAYVNGSAYVYFDPNDKWNYTNYYFASIQETGDWETKTYKLSNITNTKLYYLSTTEHNDAGFISFGGQNGTFNGAYWGYDSFNNYITMCGEKCSWGLNYQKTYLFYPSANTKGTSLNPQYLGGGYNDLNSQQTIKSAVNGADANSKATISITSYKMTGNGQVTEQTATLETGDKESYVDAARTATTTLTVGSVATGYQFDGWYTAATGGSQLSPSTTYTYYPTAATTVYARFSEKKHNVTVQYKCGDMTLKNNTTLNNVGEITTSNASNAFITGFTFSGWTLGTGVTTSNSLTSGSININTLSSGNYTLTANYTENSFAIRGGGQFGNTWDVSRPMTKQNASERIVYCTIPINGTNTGETNQAFYFKVYDATKGQWYGLQAQDFTAYYYNRNAGELGLDGADNAENIELRADVIGNYIFKIDYSDPEHTPKITVTYPDGCFLSGNFNNWKDTHSLLEGPVTIPLTKGNHQFKVHRYDSNNAYDYWCGNTGTMTRDGQSVQSGGWDMTKGVDNCTLTADIPGDYTFTYDRSSGKMTVSYPEKRTVTLEGSSYGTFVVKCDNYQQTSSTSNRTLDVPAGATITIKDIEPHNEGYDQTMVYSTDGENYTYFSDSTEIDGNRTYTYTVNSDITIAEDFRTKNDHVFYLKVTKKPFDYWCASDNAKVPRIMWTHGLNQERLYHEENLRSFTTIKKENAYTIYQVTIPAGFNTFCIYACNDFTSSKSFRILPDATKNCYELTNEDVKIIDNIPSTKGDWIASKVYLDPNAYCTYGITCNDKDTYLNHDTEERMIELPFGASLKIVDAYDISPYYMANPRYATSVVINRGFEADKNSLTLYDEIRYSANVVTKETQRVYLHLPSDLKNDWINGTTGNDWFNCIYLRDYLSYGRTLDPEKNGSNVEYGKVVRGFSHESFDANEDEYWYIDIPAGFNAFGFERKNSTGQGTGFANRTIEFEYGIPLDGVNNCFTIIDEQDGGRYTGSWGPLPEYIITLGYTDIGRYGIVIDGQTIYEDNSNNSPTRIREVPYGTEVQLLKGEPGDAAYTTNLVKEINGQKEYIIFGENETAKTFTITSDVKFDDIFATKDDLQTVFIAVPKNHDKLGKWYTCSNANHSTYGHDVYVWQTKFPYNYEQNGKAQQTMKKKVGTIETNDYTYYQYTLDKHVYELDFQFKSVIDDQGKWDSQDAHAGTIDSWCPPISTKNCFYLDGGINKKDGNDNHVNGYTGYWGYGPPCKVEMGHTNIGRYGIKDHTGEIHYATPGGTNTTFYVPYGSKVEVLEGEPGNNAYNGMVGLFNGNNLVKKFHDGQNQDNFVTITGYTMFDDLFISKAQHVVYLGVPNEGFDNWRLNDGERMTVRHIWPRDYIPSKYVNYEEMFVIDDITYYKFTLPQGLCSFQFSHRQQSNDSQISASRHFLYQIPVTEYNCFILENRQDGNLDYDGYWTKLPKPTNVGDYRLLYAEKELVKTHEEGEAEDWETAFRTVYSHPSDIITKPTQTVSLHINTNQTGDRENIHPMVILQQFKKISTDTYQWVDIEAHTVLPLTARGNMAMLPGRKKAYGDLPFYSDGIDNITNDTTYQSRLGGAYKGSGVWNFTVMLGVDNVNLNLDDVERYKGPYYIRTEALPDDGWNNYTGNLMTYSDYADYNSGFSHYFCKWLLVGNNVKFTIANDYAQSISDPLYGDATDLWGEPINYQMVERDQVLNEDANVRFAWYEMNNFVHRAYLGGSTHVKDRFLVVEGQQGKIFSHYVGAGLPAQGEPLEKGLDNGSDPRYGLEDNEEIFRDDANWIYHADIQILPGCTATVTARHYKQEQTFIKNRTLVYGEDLDKMTNKYPIRLLYDFKINRLITGYIPNGDNNTEIEAFTTDLMLIRREEPNDEDSKVTQLVFKTKAMDNSNTRAYGVLELSKERLVNDGNYNDLKRRLYWISFPFDVRIADVFGSGIYAQHWIIQSYNGQKRANNGYYYETTESNWEYHFDPTTINAGDSEYQGVLKKGVGYVVALNLYNIWKDGLLDNTKDAICLYFPSKDLISADIVQNQNITIEVPGHKCEKKGREIADSHWNVIGVPAYKNAGVNFDQPIDLSTNCAYYYRWDKAHNAYTPMASNTGEYEFSTLHAYMVQYHGGLNWKGVVREGTQSLAARSNTDHQIEHNLRLELQKDGKELDRTFVKLQENEDDVTSGFDFNYDLSKIINAGTNIYTIVKTNDLTTNVSGNVLPLAEDMVIPVGVVIDQAGEYTFSMPDGTDGIIAELIDYQTNTRTNLALDNYTVTLPAGTNHTRFAISLQPDKTITGLEDSHLSTDGSQVRKFIIDGQLYMQKDGVLYDAQGREIVNN